MSVPASPRKQKFSGSGSLGPFSVTFKLLSTADIVLTWIDDDGDETPLAVTTDYTISLVNNGNSGASVTLTVGTFPAGLLTGHFLLAEGLTPKTQPLAYADLGPFSPERHERSYDRLTMIMQEAVTNISQAIKFPPLDLLVDPTLDVYLPDAATRAGKALIFDDDGNVTVSTDAYSDQLSNVTTQAALATAQAAIAVAAAGYQYTYDTTATATDPGAGKLQFNNATLASATELYISETSGGAQALAADLATWDDGTSTIRGRLRMFKQSNPAIFAEYNITGTLTDNGSWDTFTVAYIVGAGAFVDGDAVTIEFIPKGDKGDIGLTGAVGAGTPVAAGAGTVDAITADFTTDLTLADKTLCIVISAGPNTVTNPTFAPDGLTAHTIVKNGGVALGIGDTGAAGKPLELEYNLAGTRWELLNPASASLSANTFSGRQTGGVTALTSTSAHIAIDMAVNNNFSHTLTENTTLDNPSNPVAGTSGQIAFSQHASAAKTIAYGSQWIEATTGTAPALSTTTSAQNILSYYVFDTTHIYYVLNKHGVT